MYDTARPTALPTELNLTPTATPPSGASPAPSTDAGHTPPHQDTTRWTPLRRISGRIYPPLKGASPVGPPALGTPTSVAVSGVIAVGTTRGWVLVFDFSQNLRCVCGNEGIAAEAGPVTAVALSQDHTFVAVGHAKGWIHLYALAKPTVPARSVPPTTIAAVATGRKEGHLEGSAIRHIGFVGLRHTAIVSSDDRGLAFYHALGKVLGLASTDVIRILGRYPDPSSPAPARTTSIPSALALGPISDSPIPNSPALAGLSLGSPGGTKAKKPTAILALAPLPLGPSAHPSDSLSLVAILTPTKLVVVGIKPAARTWWRTVPTKLANGKGDLPSGGSSLAEAADWANNGAVSWYPSCPPAMPASVPGGEAIRSPVLAFGWGRRLRLVRVQAAASVTDVVDFVELPSIELDDKVLAIGWYNEKVLYVLSPTSVDVYDVESQTRLGGDGYDCRTLVSYDHALTGARVDQGRAYAGSFKTHKQKLFVLTATDLRAGALLSWADRILSLMQPATILSAIELTTSYLLGLSDASTIALPSEPDLRRSLVEPKLREILLASLSFVFSDDRLRDGTHADGAAALSLFEGLVGTCVRACLATGDVDWLFDELFERYEQNGLEQIFLDRLEPFVLAGSVHALPPSVSQRLIGVHAERHQFEAAQRIIWHVDPDALDVEQALSLCQREGLYDALVYVYNRALHDYVGPMVHLLALVRKIQHRRQSRASNVSVADTGEGDDSVIEHESFNVWAENEDAVEESVPDAYKIFAYLSQALTGKSYPSSDPLPYQEGIAARNELYAFLCSPQTVNWPPTKTGQAVLTSDDEGTVEPLYPYLRLLLKFDAEALLDGLDLALEEAYLDDPDIPDRPLDRQRIVNILLDVMRPASSLSPYAQPEFSTVDLTFLHIFIARNLPKYPQFIHLSPSVLHDILVGLADDPDQSTTEDRQLGAEYLLSTYTPHDGDAMVAKFERAGFYRVLRSIYRGERKWAELAKTYLNDPDVGEGVFELLAETLRASGSVKSGGPAKVELAETIIDAVPSLIQSSETGLQQTAALFDRYLPSRHQDVLDALASSSWRQFAYLRWLLEPAASHSPDDGPSADGGAKERAPSSALNPSQRLAYLDLLAQHDPVHVIRFLESDPTRLEHEPAALAICERRGAYDALVWALDKKGDTKAALDKADVSLESRADLLVHLLRSGDGDGDGDEAEGAGRASADQVADQIDGIARVAIAVCVQRTRVLAMQPPRKNTLSGEELWFDLLSSLVATVRAVRVVVPAPARPSDRSSYRRASGASVIHHDDEGQPAQLSAKAQETLASLIPRALSSLVSTTNGRQVSFPKLMRRLIAQNARSPAANRPYAEFKAIVTSMLDSYAFEGDLLALTSKLVAQDLFEVVERGERGRRRGWRPTAGACAECGEAVWGARGVGSSPAMTRSASVSMVVETLGLGGVPRPAKRGSLKGKEVVYPEGLQAASVGASGQAGAEEAGLMGAGGGGGVVVGRDGRVWHMRCQLLKAAGAGGGGGGLAGYRLTE